MRNCKGEYLYNNYFSISEHKPLRIKDVLCCFKQIYVYALRQKLRATQYFFQNCFLLFSLSGRKTM
jgi:hypothetical protein